jgi:rhomboid-like protein
MFKKSFLTNGVKQLLIINSIVFILTLFFPPLIPLLSVHTTDSPNFQLYQIITHMFVHIGLYHIFFNMFALFIFGMSVEKRVSTILFWLFYILCGVGGCILQMLFSSPLDSMAGASGSIFGIMTIFTLLYPDEEFYLFFIPIPVKIKILYSIYILIEILSINLHDNVGHYAHLGGAMTGAIMYYLFKQIEKNAN